jgi:hypothetical protein
VVFAASHYGIHGGPTDTIYCIVMEFLFKNWLDTDKLLFDFFLDFVMSFFLSFWGFPNADILVMASCAHEFRIYWIYVQSFN